MDTFNSCIQLKLINVLNYLFQVGLHPYLSTDNCKFTNVVNKKYTTQALGSIIISLSVLHKPTQSSSFNKYVALLSTDF